MTPVYVIPQWFGNTLFLLVFLLVVFAVFITLSGLHSQQQEIDELRARLDVLDPPPPPIQPPAPWPVRRERDSTDAFLDRLKRDYPGRTDR